MKEIRRKDTKNLQQLVEMALKSFSITEKEKYVDVYDSFTDNFTISSEDSYEEDFTSSSEECSFPDLPTNAPSVVDQTSQQLPFEILC